MKKMVKLLIAVLFLISFPAIAQQNPKTTAIIEQSVQNNETISFKIGQELILSNGVVIPAGSKITVDILDAQNARRWHKSAYLVSKLKGYSINSETNVMNTLNDDVYLTIRKYEALDKKQAAKTAAELGVTTVAGFMLPGIDIAYYFTKGVIKNNNGDNRFKSGVTTAYENSIFWFWLKGKSLNLDENASIKLEEIDKEKADKLLSNIEIYKEKQEKRQERKEAFKDFMNF